MTLLHYQTVSFIFLLFIQVDPGRDDVQAAAQFDWLSHRKWICNYCALSQVLTMQRKSATIQHKLWQLISFKLRIQQFSAFHCSNKWNHNWAQNCLLHTMRSHDDDNLINSAILCLSFGFACLMGISLFFFTLNTKSRMHLHNPVTSYQFGRGLDSSLGPANRAISSPPPA